MKNYVRKIIDEDGDVFYFKENHQIHRTDGPAIEFKSGSKSWFINNKRHRIDGPALDWTENIKEWWVNDAELNFDQIAKLQDLRKIFDDDDLLSFLLLSERIIL